MKLNTLWWIYYVIIPIAAAQQPRGEFCRRPQNLAVARDNVAHYYESQCYHKEVAQLMNKAMAHFSKQVDPEKKLTFIFDIDETILSEYWFLKHIQFGYVPELDHEWIMKGEIPAIPEVKKFYDFLIQHGYHVIFLTGRRKDEYDATLKNLHREGITGFDKLIVRSPEHYKLSAREYKEQVRHRLELDGYKIVGCVGDQQSDCAGPAVGYAIKLPNYVYIIN